MRIGLVSDTHGSAGTFQKALDGPLKTAELILHAGDTLNRGGSSVFASHGTGSLADMINGLAVPILIARGNLDSEADQDLLNVPIMSPYCFLYVEGMRIMVLHSNGKREGDLEGLVERFRLSLLLHGHTHIARIRKMREGLIVNPGTPTIPNPSSPYKKTAGLFDTTKGVVEITDIETGEVVLRGEL